jgi:RNA polymerase sigma-70 factor (ECF subfamily)
LAIGHPPHPEVAVTRTVLASDDRLLAERTRLVRLCTALTGDAEAAEDLAQEAMIEAWRHRDRLRDHEGLSAWLSAIARNVCLRWSRRRGRDLRRLDPGRGKPFENPAELVPDVADLELELERGELAELLQRAMALLPADTRQALIQCYVQERSRGEVAAQLGLTEGAVGMRLMRGKLALRRALDGELREQAASFGLVATGPGWEQTRIWCPGCGRARLTCRVDVANRYYLARCSHCRMDFMDRSATYLGTVRGHRRILMRSMWEAHSYFRGALAAGSAPCACCGQETPLRQGLPEGLSGRMAGLRGVHLECSRCSAVSLQPESGLVMTLPEVEQFWRREKRVRMLPSVGVEAQGRPATLTRFESLEGAAALDVVSLQETFEVVDVYRDAGVPRMEVA